jgi:hypothetical protein
MEQLLSPDSFELKSTTMESGAKSNLLTWITVFGYALLCCMLWIAR